MKVLGIDIETGSKFTTPKDKTLVTEIGAVLWDTDSNLPVAMENFFVNEGEEVHEEASSYTGITTEMIQQYGINGDLAGSKLFGLAQKADRVCAHNGNEFDKPVLDAFFLRHKFGPMPGIWNEKNWIDTQSDIDYPSTMRSRNLIYLSACHGFVNPFQHRAITDTLSMMRILSQYDINEVVANADSQKVRVVAQVPYHQKLKAKDAGFYWDGENKVWFRQMRLNQTDAFTDKLDFPTKVTIL